MEHQDTIRNLTDTLLCVKERVKFASLRIWFEEGELKFFLTNLPQRKGKRGPTYDGRTVDIPASTPVDTSALDSAPAVGGDPSINQPLGVVQQPTNPRKRGRPPRKRPCVTSTPSNSPEQLRTLPSEEHTERINISDLSASRDFTTVDIPCSNSFQALADLDKDEENPEEEPEINYRKVLFCRECPGYNSPLYKCVELYYCCNDCRKPAAAAEPKTLDDTGDSFSWFG